MFRSKNESFIRPKTLITSFVVSFALCLGTTFKLSECLALDDVFRRLLSCLDFRLLSFAFVMAVVLFFSASSVKSACSRKRVVVGVVSTAIAMSLLIPGSWNEEETAGKTLFPWYVDVTLSQLNGLVLCLALIKVLCLATLIGSFLFFVMRVYEYVEKHHGKFLETCALARIGDFCRFKVGRLFLVSAVIFLLWIPILVINGPVCLPMDTMVQLIQMKGFPAWDPMMMVPLNDYALSDHHPFLDSLIYGFFDALGMRAGNEELGLVIYIYIWSYICVLSLVVSACWVKLRTSIPDWAIGFSLVFIAVVPCCSSYMSIVMKDTTWIPFYVFWLVAYFELIYQLRSNGSIKWQLRALFFLCTVVSGLTKKTAIYISFLSLIPFLGFGKRGLRILFDGIVSTLLVVILVPTFLFPLLKIAPGGGQEMLGTPIQQIAYTASIEDEPFSQAELDTINRVIDLNEAVASLSLSTVDPAKQSYKSECSLPDKLAFIFTWIKAGIRYPADYLKAVPFLRNYVSVGPTYYTNGAVKVGWEQSGGWAVLPQYEDGELSWTQEHVSAPLIQFLNTTFPFSLFGAEAVFVLWVPFTVVARLFAKRQWGQSLFLAPIVSTYLSMLFLPTYQTRYSISFLFSFVLITSIPFIVDGGLALNEKKD